MSDLPDGYQIRPLRGSDGAALAGAYRRNREHLAPWDPIREESFFTTTVQARLTADRLAAVRTGHGAAWVLEHQDTIVGRVNLNNMVWGAFRSGSLGYWVDYAHVGQGLATASVAFACSRAAGLGLHRVEAATMIGNTASQAVLLNCGFELVGTARDYLLLAGAWQDHYLYQRIVG